MKPDSFSFSEEDEAQSVVIGSDDERVMVKAMLTKAPALAPKKVRTRVAQGKRELLQQW